MLDKAIRATTQEHLDIYTIKDHLVVLKDGSVALIIQTSAINFDLLSDEEQDATTYAYAALLNSLSFPVQIMIRSSRKDITKYIDLVDKQLEGTKSQKVKEQIIKYRGFIKSLVKDNQVLEKQFYIIVPFSSIEVGLKPSHFNPLSKPPQKPPYDMDYILEKAQTALYPRRDHIIRQFSRIGLKSRQLTTTELVSLFYRIYNPGSNEGQFFAQPSSYETFAVQTQAGGKVQVTDEKWTEPAKPVPLPLKPAYIPTTPTKTIPGAQPVPQTTSATPAAPTSMSTSIPASPMTPPVPAQPIVQMSAKPLTTPSPYSPMQPQVQPAVSTTPVQPIIPTVPAAAPIAVTPPIQTIPTPPIPAVSEPLQKVSGDDFNPVPPPPKAIPTTTPPYQANTGRTETVIFSRPPTISDKPQ